jgi:DNA-binding LacI/PurR family transcriptional regulator
VLTPKELTGRTAVELLLDWLDKKSLGHTGGTQRTLGTQLIVRSSTAPPPASARHNGRADDGARTAKGI